MSELKEQKLLMVLRARPDNCSQVSTPNQKLQSQSQNNRTTSLAQCTWKSLTPWHSFTSGQTYSFNIVQMSLRAFQSVVLLSHSAVILSPQITKKKNSETQNNNTCCQKKPFIDKYHSPSFQAIYVPVEMRALIFFLWAFSRPLCTLGFQTTYCCHSRSCAAFDTVSVMNCQTSHQSDTFNLTSNWKKWTF